MFTLICLAAVLSVPLFISAYGWVASRRSRAGRPAGFTRTVTVFDSGRTVHLLPGGAQDHVVDDVVSCGCRPCSSLTRRASGNLVVFVDHHLLRRHVLHR